MLTFSEWLDLVDSLQPPRQFSPELKTPPSEVPMPFKGNFSQKNFAQKFIDTIRASGVSPSRVWPQSFLYDDILYWLANATEFGKQAMLLDERFDNPGGYETAVASLQKMKEDGLNLIAPSIPGLVTLGGKDNRTVVPSTYATTAKSLGLDIVTWTFDRSPPLASGGGYYYNTVTPAINNDGDQYTVLDVLAQQVGIKAAFTGWAATVVYYANCFGLEGLNQQTATNK